MNENETVKTETAPAPTAVPPTPAADPIAAARQEKRRQAARKRRRKKIIKWSITALVLLAVAGGIWYGVYKLFLEPEPVPPPQTAYSYRGSFSSSISGYGQVKANRTESVTAPVGGELLELLVSEGDTVYEGQELFRLDDTVLREQIAAVEEEIRTLEDSKVTDAESINSIRDTRQNYSDKLKGYDREIAKLREKIANRNLTAPFNGKLVELSESVREGESITEGQVLGKLVREEEMKLKCYFSYAYEDDISLGQAARVSIPANMEALEGRVTKIEKVRNITAEGAVLFAVETTVSNPGALTEGMEAIFTLTAPTGETITPAEASKLEYSQVETLKASAGGKILSLNMTAYGEYRAGEVFFDLSDDEYNEDIKNLESQSEGDRKSVADCDKRIGETQEKMAKTDQEIGRKQEQILELEQVFDKLSGVAPMGGMVTAVTAVEGQKLENGGAILAISDTSAMTVEIQLDERNVGSVSLGTPVSLRQSTSEGDQFYFGSVSSIALEGNYDWGYAYYPAVVTIENGSGLRSNSSMYYEIITSEAADCILVPVNAVKYTELGACVFVKVQEGEKAPADAPQLAAGVVPDGFYAVVVTTGMSDENQVEITSGIDEGVELYVAEGIPGTEDGNGAMIGGAMVLY